MKKQENRVWSKEQSKSPETDPREMEVPELPDKWFKIAII